MKRLGLGALLVAGLAGVALTGCNKTDTEAGTPATGGDMAKPGQGMSQAQIDAMRASRQPPASATSGGRPMGAPAGAPGAPAPGGPTGN